MCESASGLIQRADENLSNDDNFLSIEKGDIIVRDSSNAEYVVVCIDIFSKDQSRWFLVAIRMNPVTEVPDKSCILDTVSIGSSREVGSNEKSEQKLYRQTVVLKFSDKEDLKQWKVCK